MTAALRKPAPTGEFVFTDDDFNTIVELVHKVSGIALGPTKKPMVYSRLGRRLRELGMTRFDDYCAMLRNDVSGKEVMAFTNAMTTNLTRFFREDHHFDHLAGTCLPEVARRNTGRLRIWSAACSSGEEPYSIGMTLLDHFPQLPRWDARILATDLDTNMLARASRGEYAADALQPVPAPARQAHFQALPDGGGRVSDRLRQLVSFKPLNLLNAWPMKGPFDAIFCRNVMIYFDGPTKTELVQRMAGLLAPGGVLYVGHAETLLDQQGLYRLEGRTTYRRI